jgi:multidrug efflux pump subunit AcrB
VRVSAAVDPALNNSNDVIVDLEAGPLQLLKGRYGVDYAYEGRQSDQTETLGDMARGGLLALALIYLVLAWVFASYGWPLVVMSVIPFGIIGALLGHWIMGLDLTVLSLFGLFGLSGIVVNDSIILVIFYKQHKERGVAYRRAIVDATCQRLRAVLLTSLTTIAGLTPLMFETSRQAQFLIPMAVTISFGLAVATLLVLLVIPSVLCIHESVALRYGRAASGNVAENGI